MLTCFLRDGITDFLYFVLLSLDVVFVFVVVSVATFVVAVLNIGQKKRYLVMKI